MDALRFFLDQHARVHASDVSGIASFVDRILGGISDDQRRLRPGQETNSIAWLVWHMARAEDVVVNLVVVDNGRQVFDEGWARRLGVTRPDIGTGMTGDEVGQLTERLDLAAVRAYRSEVGRRTREVVAALPSPRWDEIVGPADVARANKVGAIGPRAGWLVEAWQNHSRAARLGTVAITHNALHLGEVDTLKGLLGLGPGR